MFDLQGTCVKVSDHCKSYDNSGRCVSCYKGYRLVNDKCEEAPLESVPDLGCAQWDWDNKRCLKCSERYVFNDQGRCIAVD